MTHPDDRFVIHDIDNTSPDAPKSGVYRLGSIVTIQGLGTIRIEDENLNVVPIVEDASHPGGYADPNFAWDHSTGVVRLTYSTPTRTLAEAEYEKLIDAEFRWNQAMDGGVPVTINGSTARLVFDERARNLYAAIPESTANRPTEGMPARLHPPGYQGSLVYDVKGDGVFDLVERATFGHRCAGNRAYSSVYTEIEVIKAGPGSDAEKAAAIDAIDIEVRPTGKEWPSNDIPA